MKAWTEKGTSIPYPEFLPRPWDPAPGEKTSTKADIAAFLKLTGGRLKVTPKARDGGS